MTRRSSTPSWRPLLIVLVTLLALPTVLAHGDRTVSTHDEPLTIPPGGRTALDLEVHYHRLIARVDPHGTPITLAIHPDDGSSTPDAVEVLWRSGTVDDAATFNVLIPCCDDAAWSPFHLVVTNTHPTDTAHVRLQAKLVHDDLRVGMTGVEGGDLLTVLIFTVPALLLGHRGLTTLQSGRARTGTGLTARGFARRSHLVLLSLLTLLTAATVWGASRYGGGAAGGIVAAYGVIFPTLGGLVVFLSIIVTWFVAAHLWMRGFEAAVTTEPDAAGPVAAGGLAQVLVLLIVPGLLVLAYGIDALPIALFTTLPLALVQGAASAHLLLR